MPRNFSWNALVATRIIHVLTRALLSPSLVRAVSKGKALSKGSGTVYKDLFRFWDGYFLSPGARQRARQIFPENLFRRSGYTTHALADRYDWSESSNSKISSLDPACYARNTFLPSWLQTGCRWPGSIGSYFTNEFSIQTVDRIKIISYSSSIHLDRVTVVNSLMDGLCIFGKLTQLFSNKY